MENGQVNVTISTLFTLAESLDIPCWKLLIRIEEQPVDEEKI